MNILPSNGNPYEPIDPNPAPDTDAGYMNADQPPPPPGATAADISAYATQPVPNGPPGTLQHFAKSIPGAVSGHASGIAYGLAGAALAGRGRTGSTATLVKGALAGAAACWIVSRRAPGLLCTVASVLSGYAAARYLR